MIKLFVGLGNPGAEYERTRHNAGFWWVSDLAERLKLTLRFEKNYNALMAKASFEGESIWLLEPQTYMNASGQSVGALANFFKILPEQILVIHDELDIVPGQAKLKLGGSHAGHNGLRDIHSHLGSDQYWRLRLGIGHPGVKSEVLHWVLKKPSGEHQNVIDDCVSRTLSAFEDLARGDMARATLKIHTSKPPRPKPERKDPPPKIEGQASDAPPLIVP
jgi:PTH1 family peptidyl-tRNA hydrolase